MSGRDYYARGDWNAVCSLCGGVFKASELIKHWQGMWRCKKCWEPRHPQDFVRAPHDVQTVPFVQPQLDIDIEVCTLNGVSAIPDLAQPDCSIPDNPTFDLSVSI